MATRTSYWKVIGAKKLTTGKVRLFAVQVADHLGTAMPGIPVEDEMDVNPANRLPDDTIVAKVEQYGVQWIPNPTE